MHELAPDPAQQREVVPVQPDQAIDAEMGMHLVRSRHALARVVDDPDAGRSREGKVGVHVQGCP